MSEEGNWPAAAAKFREVVALRPAAKALLALAVAERNAGNLVDARRAAMQAEQLARAAGQDQKEELAAAAESIRSTDALIAAVALNLPAGVTAPQVLVDGKAGLVDGSTLFLDPGERAIEVRAAGRKPLFTRITVQKAERRALSLPLQQDTPVDAGNGPKPESGNIPVGPIVLGSGGVAAAVIGFALWGTGTRALQSTYEKCLPPSSPEAPHVCSPDLKPSIDGAVAQVHAGNALVGVGGAAVLGAGIWWLVSRKTAKDTSPKVTAMAAPLPGGGALHISGRF